jgi:hypothetical protein
MSVVRIGYIPWFEKSPQTSGLGPFNYYGWSEIVQFEIEKLDTWKDSDKGFMKCPAFVKYVDQTWVIRSLIDITLIWDDRNKVLSSNLPKLAHDAMIRVHWGDFDSNKDAPIVAINSAFIFVADEEVWIDFMPPYNHIDLNWRLMPGSFNICNWQRPVVPTFEMLNNQVEIKRGQPLAYIKFRSRNPQDMFQLNRQERTEELEHIVNSSVTVKTYQHNLSWKVVSGIIPNKLRPKKLVKPAEPWICRFFRKILNK